MDTNKANENGERNNKSKIIKSYKFHFSDPSTSLNSATTSISIPAKDKFIPLFLSETPIESVRIENDSNVFTGSKRKRMFTRTTDDENDEGDADKATRLAKKYGNLIDILLHSLARMKAHGVSSVTFNIPNEMISIKDSDGELDLHPKIYANHDEIDEIATHYHINSFEGPCFDASYTCKKRFKELSTGTISIAKDLHTLLKTFTKLPHQPPMRDKTVFSKKEYYRNALLEYMKLISRSNKEFQEFRGALSVTSDLNQNNLNISEPDTNKVLIRIQEGENFKVNFQEIASKLAENVYQSANMETNEQINKEMSRRREMRLHVKMFKAYVRLQAFCSLNLSRGISETIRSQAKAIVVKFFPHISLQNMSLMLQRAPRIYRLLLLTDGDWRLIDSLEELSPCFFKSSMNSAANFEIWLNLVKTGKMANYEEGSIMRERGKLEMKNAKLDIIKSYFDGVDEDFKDMIDDDYDE